MKSVQTLLFDPGHSWHQQTSKTIHSLLKKTFHDTFGIQLNLVWTTPWKILYYLCLGWWFFKDSFFLSFFPLFFWGGGGGGGGCLEIFLLRQLFFYIRVFSFSVSINMFIIIWYATEQILFKWIKLFPFTNTRPLTRNLFSWHAY